MLAARRGVERVDHWQIGPTKLNLCDRLRAGLRLRSVPSRQPSLRCDLKANDLERHQLLAGAGGGLNNPSRRIRVRAARL